MTHETLSSLITSIAEATGSQVSPHVAATLSEFAAGDLEALRELGRALSPGQLTGGYALPDALPFVPAMIAEVSLEGFSKAERRILSFAALDVTRRPSLVLEASAVDASVLLLGPLRTALPVDEGRLRFRDERLRSLILGSADDHARRRAYGELRRAAHHMKLHAAELLYSARSQDSASPRHLSSHVLQAAAEQLKNGFTRNAYALAMSVSHEPSREQAALARSIAGRAAFWNGHLDEAQELLSGSGNSSSSSFAERNRSILDVIDRIRRRPPGALDTRARAFLVTTWLSEIPEARADGHAFDMLLRAGSHWYADEPEETDSILANLFLGERETPDDMGWLSNIDRMTPLMLAYLCLVKAGLYIHASQPDAAAHAIAEGARRFPLAVSAAGVVSDLIRAVAEPGGPVEIELADCYDRLNHQHSSPYSSAGPMYGARSVAALLTAQGRAVHDQTPAFSPRTPAFSPRALSRRQGEVVALIAQGRSNREIAAALGISERTVEVHVSSVLRKAGVRSRAALLARFVRTGDLSVGDASTRRPAEVLDP